MPNMETYEALRLISREVRTILIKLEDMKLHPDQCGGNCLFCQVKTDA